MEVEADGDDLEGSKELSPEPEATLRELEKKLLPPRLRHLGEAEEEREARREARWPTDGDGAVPCGQEPQPHS